MKFGLLDFDKTVEEYWKTSWNSKALLNVGDAVEYMVIEQLYRKQEIDEKELVRLSVPELISYRGESLIVPLNIALDSYVGYNKILGELSPDITPIFLGMSITSPNLTEKEIQCFKSNAPVGCRDERSYLYLKSLNIPCYLNGCTATIFKIEEKPIPEIQNKILFIDVPYGVIEFIPKELKKDIVFLSQELYCKKLEQNENFTPKDWAKKILAYYRSEPRMIVTSRFHGAVLAIANDIPAIITLEKNTFRFSWLQNYYPIYTEENFSEIDWGIRKVNFNSERMLISSVAKDRIRTVIETKQNFLKLTDLQRRKSVLDEPQASNQVLYYRRVWEKIQETWDVDNEYFYSLWGINDNAEKLYSLISEKYSKAKLVDIYDLYKDISFKGLLSKKPTEIIKYNNVKNYFLIVTAYLASRVVEDICEMTDFPIQRTFLCERDFISSDDLI